MVLAGVDFLLWGLGIVYGVEGLSLLVGILGVWLLFHFGRWDSTPVPGMLATTVALPFLWVVIILVATPRGWGLPRNLPTYDPTFEPVSTE